MQTTEKRTPKREPRGYQSAAVPLLQSKLREYGTACLVKPTGTGKTFTIAHACANTLRSQYDRVFFITHQDPLPKQWMAALHEVGFDHDLGAIVSDDTKLTFGDLKHRGFVHTQCKAVVTMLPTLRGRLEKNKVSRALLKGRILLVYDECHKTRFWDASREFENLIRSVCSELHIIGVTATPARHPKETIEFTDGYYFPQCTWVSTITQQEAIDLTYWKKTFYVPNTNQYISESAEAFKGLQVDGDGEVPDTKQSTVMRELIPSHWRDWLAGQASESRGQTTFWACVDRKHADALCDHIQLKGDTAIVVDGRTESKYDAITAIESGEYQHICVIGCLQEGADIPRICQIVLCRIFGSAATICQIVGRGVRKWDDMVCRVFDFGQNWAEFPYPCQIDWWTYRNSKKMFRDSAMVLCQDSSCRKKHDGVPKPLHPSGDRLIVPILSLGEYSNGDVIDLDEPLICHGCGTIVTCDPDKLAKYAQWRSDVREAMAKGDHPPRPKFKRSGITIGPEWKEILTPRVMYESSLWDLEEKGDGEAPISTEDKSKKWLSKVELVALRSNALETKQRAVKHLPIELKSAAGFDFGRCKGLIPTGGVEKAIRAAICVQYLNGRSPSSAWSLFGDDDQVIARFGPNSPNPVPDSNGKPLRAPNAIRGAVFDRNAFEILDKLNNCLESQIELDQWLSLEIEKLSEPEKEPTHPKFQRLTKSLALIRSKRHDLELSEF